MKRSLLLVCMFLTITSLYGQEDIAKRWSLDLNGGWNATHIEDRKLNTFRYSGSTFNILLLNAMYRSNKGMISVQASGESQTLNMTSVDEHYEFNYIKARNGRVTISYLHKIGEPDNRFRFFSGVGNTLTYAKAEQYFRSLLYPAGRSLRKTFIFSPISLSAIAAIHYEHKQNLVAATFGYTLLSVPERPGDSYVKQIGVDYSSYWKSYGFPDLTGLDLMINYKYRAGKLMPSIGYNMTMTNVDEFKSIQHTVRGGVSLIF